MAFLPAGLAPELPARISERFAQALLEQNTEASFAVRLGSESVANQVARSLVKLGVTVETSPDGVTLHVRRP